MVQIFDNTPTESSASMIGKALGTGFGKRAAISEAENAFQQAEGNPLKLASAMARLVAASPDLARAGGPMYESMLNFMKGGELAGQKVQPQDYIPQNDNISDVSKGPEAPSITERDPIEETIKPYIPPTQADVINTAAQKYPKLYARAPMEAIQLEQQNVTNEIARSNALQEKRNKQENVESTVKSKLQTQIANLGIKPGSVAGNLISKIEDKAINAVKPKDQGGEGLTEQQAAKKYGKEIEDANRDYNVIKSWGGTWTMGPWNANKVKGQISSTRENFRERNDLENFADLLVGETGMSNKGGYYFAYPPKEIPELNKELKSMPKVSSNVIKGIGDQTSKYAPKLAKSMGNEGSPLAIAQELDLMGYDSDVFLDYVRKNRKELNLTERQGRELGKSVTGLPNLTDIYMFITESPSSLKE